MERIIEIPSDDEEDEEEGGDNCLDFIHAEDDWEGEFSSGCIYFGSELEGYPSQ